MPANSDYFQDGPWDERDFELHDRVTLVRDGLWKGANGTITDMLETPTPAYLGVTFDGIGLVWCEPKDLVFAPDPPAGPPCTACGGATERMTAQTTWLLPEDDERELHNQQVIGHYCLACERIAVVTIEDV